MFLPYICHRITFNIQKLKKNIFIINIATEKNAWKPLNLKIKLKIFISLKIIDQNLLLEVSSEKKWCNDIKTEINITNNNSNDTNRNY